MTPAKIEKIKKEFFRNNEEMGEVLNTTGKTIGQVLKADQRLPIDSIGILLTKYKIDSDWFFAGDDDSPIKFKDDEIPDSKYYEVLAKLNKVQEELLEYATGRKRVETVNNTLTIITESK